jgi:diaminohydroxyphosphoribosylaminopyrimidine deaminase / 5-amino-6-(5-phosphoribosylamino)uracil reductase
MQDNWSCMTMTQNGGLTAFNAWSIAHAAAKAIGAFDTAHPARFSLGASGWLCPLEREDSRAVLTWSPISGWEPVLAPDDPQRDLLELYLPISSATTARPITIGHLGQSLDGFIATMSGDSCFITGPENILHLHRLRALCDAVVVGAGTIAADNPRLTTRLVSGSNPVRVILDPGCRLLPSHTVFSDGEAMTLRACAAGNTAATAARARGEDVLEIPARGNGLDLHDLLRQLRARGYCRIFVEGGGTTVSSFLEAGLLDRLHIAVAPLLIGEGRPAIRMPPQVRLQDCLRLHHRVYLAGNDILFDCDLRAKPAATAGMPRTCSSTAIQRIL